MRNWKWLMWAPFVWLLLFHSAGALAQTDSTTSRTSTSPNGQHGIKVVESITISGRGTGSRGPIVFRRLTISATALAISPNGTTSEQWQWSSSKNQLDDEFSVAGAQAADSGKLFVLITRDNGNPFTAAGEDIMPPQLILLDEKGKSHAAVTAGSWWKALGPDGKVSPDNPPALRFLENEKILEIKLASGKTVRVNTDTGDLSVEKAAETASAPATAPSTSPAPPAGGK